jgi:molybdopterin synthase catalytic subunit
VADNTFSELQKLHFMKNISIKLTSNTLSLRECYDFVEDPVCGGIDIFVGTVRNHTIGKTVCQLDFSAYSPMAIKEMGEIAKQVLEKYEVHKIAIHHAEGILKIGDIPVIIAVSAAHRAAAFDACKFAIDRSKETVPIWKKEYFEDGEVWVNAHP